MLKLIYLCDNVTATGSPGESSHQQQDVRNHVHREVLCAEEKQVNVRSSQGERKPLRGVGIRGNTEVHLYMYIYVYIHVDCVNRKK